MTVNSDELYIVGEKEGVARVVQALQKDHEIVVSFYLNTLNELIPLNSYFIGHCFHF